MRLMLWKAGALVVAMTIVAVAEGGAARAQTPDDGIWISRADLMALPMTGPSWNRILVDAAKDCSLPDLTNQDDLTNVCIMAKALVAARTGDPVRRDDVMAALTVIADGAPYVGRALSLGRELGAYVIAADLIELRAVDPALDVRFRARLSTLLTTPTLSGPASLIECHELRPNNWGAHCGASRIAVAMYLGNQTELARAAAVFKGWVGDRSSYAGFNFSDNLDWQCNPEFPVGINPVGCLKLGQSIDGVLADDQQRSGLFVWPPPQENYVYEALQGALAQAILLDRAGYPAFEWESRALLRAFQWLHTQANFPTDAEDIWEAHVINHYYGTDFPAAVPARPGKNVGWTDWTHPPTGTPPPPPPPPPPTGPTGLTIPKWTVSSVDLVWTDTSGTETAFHIERAGADGVFAEVGVTDADITAYVDNTVSSSTTYTYRVRASNAVGVSPYSAVVTVTTPTLPLLLKTMTFEGGSLKDLTTGADAVSGSVALEGVTPLKGRYSAKMIGTSKYLEERFTATVDLYVSVYVRLTALPTSDVRLLQVMNSSTTVGNLVLRAGGQLRLRNSSTTIGADSAPLVVGQLYRIGLHQRAGTGANAMLEAFAAVGDGEFGSPFATTAAGIWKTLATKVRIGATTGSLSAIVDDAMFTTNVMPWPSN